MTEKSLPSPPALAFKFTQYDIGNSPIITIGDGSLAFALATKRGLTGSNKITTLTVYDTQGGSTLGGLLDWKNKTMEVMGVTKSWKEIKSKPGGALSLTREWVWLGKKYTTYLKHGQWTVKFGQEVLTTLTPLTIHTFKKDELATLTFHSDVSKEEMIFLIFVTVFATLQLPPRKKPLSAAAAAGEVTADMAVGVAAGAATDAVFSCCTIQ